MYEVYQLTPLPLSIEAVDRIILTHEHPDHIGGLPLLYSRHCIPLAAHPLAAESLCHPQAAQQRSFQAQREICQWIGVPEDTATAWLMTQRRPILPSGVAVAKDLVPGKVLDGFIRILHLPGHAAGQVGLGVDEVLFTADHLLPGRLPPLWPERLRPFLGLEHYLHSLTVVEQQGEVEQILPSHGLAVEQPKEAINQVRRRISDKLNRIAGQISTLPDQTIFEITQTLYPAQPAPRARLLLSQTAALIEYLARQGLLSEGQNKEGAATWAMANQTSEISFYRE